MTSETHTTASHLAVYPVEFVLSRHHSPGTLAPEKLVEPLMQGGSPELTCFDRAHGSAAGTSLDLINRQPKSARVVEYLHVRRTQNWLSRHFVYNMLVPLGIVTLACAVNLLALPQALAYLAGYAMAGCMLKIACDQTFAQLEEATVQGALADEPSPGQDCK